MIVDDAVNSGASTVTYFYCKYQDPGRDNFKSVTRAPLAQFVQQNRNLLPFLYEECASNGQVVLESEKQIRDLLKTTCKGVEDGFIIVDGPDECSIPERRKLLTYLPQLISEANEDQKNTLRGLFVSRDEGDIRNLLSKAITRTIEARDNEIDIQSFAKSQLSGLIQKFDITENQSDELIAIITKRAKGE